MGHNSDGLRYMFERELIYKPGEKYVYNSGLPVTLSEILRRESGLPIDKFAEKNLFKHLGITDYMWERLQDSTFHAGGGLHLYPRDMAKLGKLYMNKGEYNGNRIINEIWFDNCSKKYFTGEGPEYWNHWSPDIYFINDVPVEVYSAGGLGGQFIYAIPKFESIVIFTSDLFGYPNQMKEIMKNYILPTFIESGNKENYTSKEIVINKNYNWGGHWLSEMACTAAGLNFLDKNISPAWLYGSTGSAFLINAKENLSTEDVGYATNYLNRELNENLGYSIISIEAEQTDPDFLEKQKDGWGKIRAAIDEGLPCYGYHFGELPEYYIIFGYDDIGYYYKGIDHYSGSGPVYWKNVGLNSTGKLSLKVIHPADKVDEIKTIKDALTFAVNYYKDRYPKSKNYTIGPDAYTVWANALQNKTTSGFGAALHAVAWIEGRRLIVDYLNECKSKLSQIDQNLFNEAITHYSWVVKQLEELSELYPFFVSNEIKNSNVLDETKSQLARKLLTEAKFAEIEGIKLLEKILKRMN